MIINVYIRLFIDLKQDFFSFDRLATYLFEACFLKNKGQMCLVCRIK